ncbi:ORC-CDC6 family AAA ATPase [Salinarimonas sp. NSM]|uniref:ORC-CDC6 family AAA ATPase n=1 Tax=Salinarimonas sp. NSM TaxID=3458003 RepID=UPI00403621A0
MDAEINPFRPTRWEHDHTGLPLIWFAPTARALAGDKSAYVHGSRGSGKTTLLRSICWEDLLRNPSLRLQRKLSDFKYIGVYVRLPDHVSQSMGRADWQEIFPLARHPELEFHSFFSLAIELICLEKTLTAVHSLRVAGELTFQAEAEFEVVEKFLSEFPQLTNFLSPRPLSFDSLAKLMRTVIRRMNEATGRGFVSTLIDSLPARQPNEMLVTLCKQLSSTVKYSNSKSSSAPGFKFCLDDCEVLSQLQLKSLNTMVRVRKFPISWVVCAVGDAIEGADTFLPEQPLTDADRVVVPLDFRVKEDFYKLCEAVSSLRVFFSLPPSDRPKVTGKTIASIFSLDEKLGSSSVNDILHLMIRRSTSPLARQIRAAAELLLRHINDQSDRKISREGIEPLPYYQAYILWHWMGRGESFKSVADESDLERMIKYVPMLEQSNHQAWLRRKMVGALLQISARIGFKRLPLSGSNIIISLSDGSIRDFLEIMADVYDAYRDAFQKSDETVILRRFSSRTKIANSIQTEGIYKSSNDWFEGVGGTSDPAAVSMSNLIEALAKYTSSLQSTTGHKALSTSERGVFILRKSDDLLVDDEEARLYAERIISRAELAGYLRTVPLKHRAIRGLARMKPISGFRLHRRFAPRFLFSYRGAYEPVRLSVEYLSRVCLPGADLTPDQWVAGLVKDAPEEVEQLLLPLIARSDDD